ncbi:hypothetical protein L9F63_017646, partial [Diploptera punctata]
MAYYETPLIEALTAPSPDHETSTYLLPRLSAKYQPHRDWESAPDPRFYVLTELERETNQANRRVKRTGTGPSLSIVNPLDVLRQRLLLEIARRRMRQTQNMIQANRDFLESIGKRQKINQETTTGLQKHQTGPRHRSHSGIMNTQLSITHKT